MRYVAFISLLAIMIPVASTASGQSQAREMSTAPDPRSPTAVEILDVETLSTPAAHAVTQLVITYRSAVTGPGDLVVRLPSSIRSPSNRSGQSQLVRRAVPLTKGNIHKIRITLYVEKSGAHLIEAVVSAPEASSTYDRSDGIHFYVESTSEAGRVTKPWERANEKRMINFLKRDPHNESNAAKKSSQVYSHLLALSGKVQFSQSLDPEILLGVPGVRVYLFFKNCTNQDCTSYTLTDPADGSTLTDPFSGVPLSHPVRGYAEGTHFSTTDIDGNYSFNFTYTSATQDAPNVMLFVGRTNDMIALEGSYFTYNLVPSPVMVKQGGSAHHSSVPDSIKIFHPAEGAEPTFRRESTSTVKKQLSQRFYAEQNIRVNTVDGRILRYSFLSNDLVRDIYDSNIPFSLPRIEVETADGADGYCGQFRLRYRIDQLDFRRYIVINRKCIDGDDPDATVSHEYGHWVNYQMWGDRDYYFDTGPLSDDADPIFTEGWAIFFSFAVRNYASKQFGDQVNLNVDNPEIAPFEIGSTGRYSGSIKYAGDGQEEYAAFASMLWSFYDGRSTSSSYESSSYFRRDNDEIDGDPKKVFEGARLIYHVADNAKVDNYFVDALEYLGIYNQTEYAAAQRIERFMFEDLESIPATPMRPVQVSNLNGSVSNSNVTLSWNRNAYSSNLTYANTPTRYRIRRNGAIVAEAGPFTTSKTLNLSVPNGAYTVTSLNGGGEAIGEAYVYAGLRATLSGPTALDNGEQGTWYASYEGVQGPVTYEWTYVEPGSSVLRTAPCTSSVCSLSFYNTSSLTKTAKVQVTVRKNQSVYRSSVDVGIIPPGSTLPPPTISYLCGELECHQGQITAVQDLDTQRLRDRTGRLEWSSPNIVTPDEYTVEHRESDEEVWTTLTTIRTTDAKASSTLRIDSIEVSMRHFQYDIERLSIGTHEFRVGYALDGEDEWFYPSSRTLEVNLRSPYETLVYPNPVQGRSKVEVTVQDPQRVTIELYDVLGRRISQLFDGPLKSNQPGRWPISVDRLNLSSGTYFVRVAGESFATVRKISVVR